MEAAVNDLVAMTGRTKDDCTLAIRAARGSPDVAYDILTSGIPLNQLASLGAAGGEGGFPAGGDEYGDEYGDESDASSGVGGGAGLGSSAFEALRNNPNFGLIRQRIL